MFSLRDQTDYNQWCRYKFLIGVTLYEPYVGDKHTALKSHVCSIIYQSKPFWCKYLTSSWNFTGIEVATQYLVELQWVGWVNHYMPLWVSFSMQRVLRTDKLCKYLMKSPLPYQVLRLSSLYRDEKIISCCYLCIKVFNYEYMGPVLTVYSLESYTQASLT